MEKNLTALGFMSGTSGDGIDASLIKSDGENEIHFVGNQFLPYPDKIKIKIRSLKEKINLTIDLEKKIQQEEKYTYIYIEKNIYIYIDFDIYIYRKEYIYNI